MYEYEVNIECGYEYRHGIILDTNMNMGMGTRYGMLFVPYCLLITLVSKNYKKMEGGKVWKKNLI